MRLEALTAGIGAGAGPFRGQVHSVFTRACNITRAAGGLLALVVREVGAVPRGFQLATPPAFSFLDIVRRGQAVACRGGILRIEGSPLSVELRPARPWRSALPGLALDLGGGNVARAWAVAWSKLVETQGEDVLPRQAAGPIAALLRATRALRGKDAATAAAGLIGLGTGLTPAGDDFLIGFLAGLWRTAGCDPARRAFLADVGAAIAATTATNAISRGFLEAAAEGEVSEPLAVLADRLAHGAAPEEVRAAVRAALAVGASSGAAGALGLLTGARAWAPIRDPAAGGFSRALLRLLLVPPPLDDQADRA